MIGKYTCSTTSHMDATGRGRNVEAHTKNTHFLPICASNQLSGLLFQGRAYTRSSERRKVPLSGNELGQSSGKQGQHSVAKVLMSQKGEEMVLSSSDSCKNHSLSVLLTIHGLKTWCSCPHEPSHSHRGTPSPS